MWQIDVCGTACWLFVGSVLHDCCAGRNCWERVGGRFGAVRIRGLMVCYSQAVPPAHAPQRMKRQLCKWLSDTADADAHSPNTQKLSHTTSHKPATAVQPQDVKAPVSDHTQCGTVPMWTRDRWPPCCSLVCALLNSACTTVYAGSRRSACVTRPGRGHTGQPAAATRSLQCAGVSRQQGGARLLVVGLFNRRSSTDEEGHCGC